MIAAWMLTASLFALFAAIAAVSGEQVLRIIGRPTRGVWSAAIAASVLWPLYVALRADHASSAGVMLPPIRVTQLVSPALGQSSSRWMPGVDRALVVMWLAASVFMLLRLVSAAWNARQVRRAAERAVIGGVAVLVSEDAGPAVVGLLRPDIVYPRALLGLDPALREVIVRHEDEHRQARDVWMALGCSVALVLMPWSAALWWMTRRARLALEIDCDARVLRTHADPVRYGKLLLLVSQTDTSARLVPALISPRTHLEWRIRAMLSTTPAHRHIRVAAGTASLVFASVAALSAQVTNTPLLAVRPALADTLRARLLSSGMTPDEVRARLRSRGFPDSLLDSYIAAPSAGVSATMKPDTGTGPKKVAGDTYFEFQTEQQARIVPGSFFLKYPVELLQAPVAGSVLVQFVVDDTGAVVLSTFKVLKTSGALFTTAVRDALASSRWTPAKVGGRAVKQLVQQPFDFPIPPKQ